MAFYRDPAMLFRPALLFLILLGVGCGAGPVPPSEWPDLSLYPWFYLRNGRPLALDPTTGRPVEAVVELIAVGDVMPGRAVAEVAAPLAEVAPWLAAADLTLGNLEAVLVSAGTPRTAPPGEPQPIILSAPPAAVETLQAAGFDLLGLANNHSLDYGPSGLAETAGRLDAAGITVLGAGPGEAAAAQPQIQQIRGVRLAFFAFNDVVEPDPVAETTLDPAWRRATWDPAAAAAAISAVKNEVDGVVVSIHWGYEYELRADPRQAAVAQTLFDAGADLVVGHHPHVVQPLAAAPGRLAAYSLGNLLFDQQQGETGEGLALRVFFDTEGLRAVQGLPLRSGPRPRLMTPAEGRPLLARITPPPQVRGFTCDPADCRETTLDSALRPGAAALFWSGQLDLTGDGLPETVRRAGEQISIEQEGAVVWQSPPEWRVVDAALGDPNDDGRGELLLALWRPDPDGYPRSQPYIVGYRGGAYKLMWGGRPLVRPLLEVELGDVDEDGRQELVVLEDQGDGRATIAVWRWQGWNFSLAWRSEPGRFRDLLLVPHEAAGQVMTVTEPY